MLLLRPATVYLLLYILASRHTPSPVAEAAAASPASLLASGLEAERALDYDRAVALYARAADVGAGSPHVWVAHYNLAAALRKLGRLDEAVAAGSHAWRLNPRSSDAAFNLGNALQERHQHMEAIELFEAAIELAPDRSADARVNLGASLEKVGRDIDGEVGSCRPGRHLWIHV